MGQDGIFRHRRSPGHEFGPPDASTAPPFSVQGSYMAEGRKIVVRFIRRRRERLNGSGQRTLAAEDTASTHSRETPPPGHWVSGLASQLSLIANTLQQGELHNAVQNLAGPVIRKGGRRGRSGGLTQSSALPRALGHSSR